MRLPMLAMTNPNARGLTVVRYYYGEMRPAPTQGSVTSGEEVQDAEGKVSIFAGTDTNGDPILVETNEEFQEMKTLLIGMRLRFSNP